MIPKYEEDFYGWAMGSAQLLKERKLSEEFDIEHFVEELESLGGNQYDQLVNRFAVLIAHLLKWQYQPDFRGRSWNGTIKEQRNKIERVIRHNPSLKGKLTEAFEESYIGALNIIEGETPIDLKLIPQTCPYTCAQCQNDKFYPGENNHP